MEILGYNDEGWIQDGGAELCHKGEGRHEQDDVVFLPYRPVERIIFVVAGLGDQRQSALIELQRTALLEVGDALLRLGVAVGVVRYMVIVNSRHGHWELQGSVRQNEIDDRNDRSHALTEDEFMSLRRDSSPQSTHVRNYAGRLLADKIPLRNDPSPARFPMQIMAAGF